MLVGNEKFREEDLHMLWTVFVVLMLLWLLGLVSGYTFSGFIWVLMAIAVIAFIFQILRARRVV
jgi:fatty acid desaturase